MTDNGKAQPDRMRTVNPYLMVDKVDGLIRFLELVFGGELLNKLGRPDGSVMHAEIRIGDSLVMAGEPMEAYGTVPASLYVYVADCDSVYEKALQHGAVSIMVPAYMRHAGERYGGVKDAWGNIWWIATHVEDLTPEEQARRIEESSRE